MHDFDDDLPLTNHKVFSKQNSAEDMVAKAGDFGKSFKSDANYMRAHGRPLSHSDHVCGNCKAFVPKPDYDDRNSCKKVRGPIHATYWCKFFTMKNG